MVTFFFLTLSGWLVHLQLAFFTSVCSSLGINGPGQWPRLSQEE